VPDGPDPLSEVVSYGLDPVEQIANRDDAERHKQSFPSSGGLIDIDGLLEKPPGGGGGGGRRLDRDARDRELRSSSPSALDPAWPKHPARDREERPRSDKPAYYDSYGPGKDISGRLPDWDERRDRERR
jgi:hypothetical protein